MRLSLAQPAISFGAFRPSCPGKPAKTSLLNVTLGACKGKLQTQWQSLAKRGQGSLNI